MIQQQQVCRKTLEDKVLVGLGSACMSGSGPQVALLGFQSLLATEPPMMLLRMAVGW
jgi:hypothetical protein